MTAQWLPIDTAPKDGTDILLYDGDTMVICRWNERRKEWVDSWNQTEFETDVEPVTHWMPLPEPPK